jgi:O-antigen/teichoic acid export membrane protein
MMSFFAISLTYIYGTILTAAGKISIFNKIVLIGVLINLVLNLILIPKKGAYGAAIATVFTQYFVLLGQYIVSLYYFKIGFDYSILLRRLLFFCTLGLASYIVKTNLDMNWLYLILISGIISVLIALLTGLIKLSDIKK